MAKMVKRRVDPVANLIAEMETDAELREDFALALGMDRSSLLSDIVNAMPSELGKLKSIIQKAKKINSKRCSNGRG